MEAQLRWRIGDVTVTKIPELESGNVPASFLFPQWNDAQDHASLALSRHSWLVETPQHTVIIDTATGNDKFRPLNPSCHQLQTHWLDHLQQAGVAPEDVDYVFLTHLHVDHVGWNTRLVAGQWHPTFPNAHYVFSAREFQHYLDEDNVWEPSKGIFADSLLPITRAGQDMQLTHDDPLPVPGFRIHATPGHSHDHWSFSLTVGAETAFFWGDVLHHPIQVQHPELNSVFCEDPDAAHASRRRAIAFALAHNATIFTTHFPASSAGRIRQTGDTLEWQPL